MSLKSKALFPFYDYRKSCDFYEFFKLKIDSPLIEYILTTVSKPSNHSINYTHTHTILIKTPSQQHINQKSGADPHRPDIFCSIPCDSISLSFLSQGFSAQRDSIYRLQKFTFHVPHLATYQRLYIITWLSSRFHPVTIPLNRNGVLASPSSETLPLICHSSCWAQGTSKSLCKTDRREDDARQSFFSMRKFLWVVTLAIILLFLCLLQQLSD